VVDDEPMVRALLADAVQRAGAEVITAADGAEGLQKYQEHRSPLIITDIRMPGMNGLELLQAVKDIDPRSSVVLVTGYENDADLALKYGASHILPKPFRFDELRQIITNTLAQARPVTADQSPVLTADPKMEGIVSLARRVARTDATVLIQGETGTGKEVLARFIHRTSPRSRGQFVAVNCSALPETLIEAELFGHERGAFTGAIGRREGRFEAAAGGTLLLDEVTEIPVGVQAKLLRALQEREVARVGSNQSIKVDARVIATTNRDLRIEVREGRFRQDLFYRLNVIHLQVPPLRERPGDIALLARHFLQKYAAAHASQATGYTPEALEALTSYSWPGNVRELENVIQRAAILCLSTLIAPEHIHLEEHTVVSVSTPRLTVADMERNLIMSTLERLKGNRTHTAKELGLSVRTIRNRLREYRQVS
jgi:two-component system response regulator FlrC